MTNRVAAWASEAAAATTDDAALLAMLGCEYTTVWYVVDMRVR